MWLLTFRAAGMGLCMMPIMTGGIAVIPPSLVSQAGAFNNVVQRTTAALGLAMLTAMVSDQQAQQIEDRTALIPAGTPMPQLGPDAGEGVAGLLAVYQETQNQVFVSALNDMYIVTAIVTAAGVVLALMLHHGPAPAAPQDPTPEAREPEPAAEAAAAQRPRTRTARGPDREQRSRRAGDGAERGGNRRAGHQRGPPLMGQPYAWLISRGGS